MAKKEKVNHDFLSPPLQFAGNKKAWAAELMDEALLLPSGCTVWDCFGGSGVCARAVKNARPDVHVVWNDFDGYSERCAHAAETEQLRRELVRLVGCKNNHGFTEPIKGEARQAVIDLCLEHEARYGFFDSVSVSRWLCIGCVSLPFDPHNPRPSIYFNVRKSPIDVSACFRWFDGLDVVSFDVFALPVKPGDFIILDPPYVETDCKEYAGQDTLQILKRCRSLMESCPFVLFGDSSISFWYEILTEKFSPRFFIKDAVSANRFGKKRGEVMFSNW